MNIKSLYTSFFFISILFTFKNSYADFKLIKVSNFNAEYQAPSGTATADEFITPLPSSEQIEIRFFKRGISYVFVHEEKEYVLNNPPSILNDVQNFSIAQFNLNSEKSIFKSELARSDIYAKDSEIHLRKFDLNCPEKNSTLKDFERVIDSCSTNSKIKLEFASFKDTALLQKDSNSIQSFLAAVFFDPQTNYFPLSTNVQITNLNVSVSQNAFQLAMGIKLDIPINVKGSGMIWFQPNEKQTKIRLDVLKASLLDVKERVFKEIEKKADPHVIVQRPYIIIKQK